MYLSAGDILGVSTMLDVVSFVAKAVRGYSGYKRDKRKEDDLAVKRKISTEISKARNNLTNVLTSVSENGDRKASESVKRLIGELEVFENESRLSEVGHSYAFFSPQKSIDGDALKKVVEFDKGIIEKIETVTIATSKIETVLIDGEDIDVQHEFTKIRQFITNARNDYKNRIDFIKGLK